MLKRILKPLWYSFLLTLALLVVIGIICLVLWLCTAYSFGFIIVLIGLFLTVFFSIEFEREINKVFKWAMKLI